MAEQPIQDALEGVAIIGMSGRFPGAQNINEFWEKLKDGKECITYFSKEDARACGVDEESINDPNYVFAAGILEDIELFDAGFFSLNPKEAENLDPQQRLFLECSYEALEDAGYSCNQYDYPIGVYAGSNMSYYFLYHLFNKLGVKDDLAIAVGNDKDYVATRASYEFNLKGPSINVQSACSTSMTAVAMAYEGLLNYHCDMAIAGGAGIKLPQKSGYLYQTGFIGSPDGHTRPFDADAYGTVFTSAVGVILLKRVEDAIRDGDHIYAVIKGMAVNNDGSTKVGFTAPSREGEAEVIAAAQNLAGVHPEDISYIEAHGTGTALGDPIEISALNMVFEQYTNKKSYCAIGSVKSNIGHAISGAGISGMIKTVLALKHKQIPPSINFSTPNPKIDFENSPFYVNSKLCDWETGEKARIAGVSSFGFGGTNVHAVVEEAPPKEVLPSSKEWQLITLSAKAPAALEQMCLNLSQYFRENPTVNFSDAVYTLHVGRKEFDYRCAILCKDFEDAIRLLEAKEDERIFTGVAKRVQKENNTANSFIENGSKDAKEVLASIGKFWVEGAPVDWETFHCDEKRHRIPLPTYPFQRKRYWVEQYNRDDLIKKSNPISSKKSDFNDWLYFPSWKRAANVPFVSSKLEKDCTWLVFEDEIGLSENIVRTLKEEGVQLVTVSKGDKYCKINQDSYTINPNTKEHYVSLIKDVFKGNKPGNILHLWNVTEEELGCSRLEFSEECLSHGFHSLLCLAQAMGETIVDHNVKMAVVSNNMQVISDEKVCYPEKAVITGPCKVIPMEYSNIFCQSIDLVFRDISIDEKNRFAKAILAEISVEKPQTTVVLRGNQRWLPTIESTTVESINERSWVKEGGTYLITGGLGGIGLAVALRMANTARVNLVLTRRSAFPEKDQWQQWLDTHSAKDATSDIIKQVKVLEELGAEVMALQAETSCLEQMREVVEQAKLSFGAINGVIHAAGISGNGLIQEKQEEAADKVFAPKVAGTLIIDELFKDEELDFLVLFSSSSSILGGAGFVDYCGANAVLDAYAHYRSQRSNTFTVSVNWDEWDEVGMAVKAGSKSTWQKITVHEGLTLLERIIASKSLAQVAVVPYDFIGRLQEIEEFRISSVSGDSVATKETNQSNNRPDLYVPYTDPQNELEEEIAEIWQEHLGVYPVGIHDDFFELGGHSLLATSLISILRKKFHKNVDLQSFFEQSTVAQLAKLLGGSDENSNELEEEFDEGLL